MKRLQTNTRTALRDRRSRVLGLISLLVFALGTALFIMGQNPVRQEATRRGPADGDATPELAEQALPAPTAGREEIRLFASVTAPDVELFAQDRRGRVIEGRSLTLLLVCPDGRTQRVTTDLAGRCRCSGLTAGEYRVWLAEEGYAQAQSLRFSVRERQSFRPLGVSHAPVEAKTVEALPREEVRQAPVERTTTVWAETIDTASLPTAEPQAAEEAGTVPAPSPQESEQGGPVVVYGDEAAPTQEISYIYPEPYYDYSYELGPNGRLLLADGTESEVYPVEEDGLLVGGRLVRRVITRIDEDGNRSEVDEIPEEAEDGVRYETEERETLVPVLNDDGSALPDYQIAATLITPEPIPVVVEPAPTPVPTPAPTPKPQEDEVVVIGKKYGWQEEEDGLCFYGADGRRVTGLKEIDGKLCYFSDTGVKARAVGIDVSYFNGAIDWNAVKAHGVDFVIVRLAGRTWGGGVLFEDEYSYRSVNGAGRYLQEARAAGLQIGAYVWSSAVNAAEAEEEAALALQILGGMPLDLPLYIDMEYSGSYPNGRADRLTVQQRNEIVRTFCSTVSNGGYRPGVYAGQNYWKAAISYSACSGYSIWMASYTENQQMPTDFPWPYNVWQCSASAYVRGVSGASDLNIIF